MPSTLHAAYACQVRRRQQHDRTWQHSVQAVPRVAEERIGLRGHYKAPLRKAIARALIQHKGRPAAAAQEQHAAEELRRHK
jgi:hypothetical protein